MRLSLLNLKKLTFSLLLLSAGSLFAAPAETVNDKLKALEATTEGRLGIFAVNTQTGHVVEYRANEVFPSGCTSKVLGVAAVLHKSMSDHALLDLKVKYSKDDLRAWSPITEKHLHDGQTVKELCAASISYSDNTAMNLLLKTIGGVQGITAFARSIGNQSFSQDNDWPLEAYSGGVNNVKDASTPKAMVESLGKLTIGKELATPQRELLNTWLKETTTGAARIKSAIPATWVIGHKTGTGASYGSTNDLAILWPNGHEPLMIGIYYTSDKKEASIREDVVSKATKLIVDDFMKHDKKLEA